MAVSKTKPVQDLEEAYNAGQRVFGENYVQVQRQLPLKAELLFIFVLDLTRIELALSATHDSHPPSNGYRMCSAVKYILSTLMPCRKLLRRRLRCLPISSGIS